MESVGSHALLHISQSLGGLSCFDGLCLVVNHPLDCETRHAAVMAAVMLLLSRLRTCLSISTVDIALQVCEEERRQSAAGARAASPIPQVVVTVRCMSYPAPPR